jgi:hypothetical protein
VTSRALLLLQAQFDLTCGLTRYLLCCGRKCAYLAISTLLIEDPLLEILCRRCAKARHEAARMRRFLEYAARVGNWRQLSSPIGFLYRWLLSLPSSFEFPSFIPHIFKDSHLKLSHKTHTTFRQKLFVLPLFSCICMRKPAKVYTLTLMQPPTASKEPPYHVSFPQIQSPPPSSQQSKDENVRVRERCKDISDSHQTSKTRKASQKLRSCEP